MICHSSTLEGAGIYEQESDQEKMKSEVAVPSHMYRHRMPMSTPNRRWEAKRSSPQPKDDDVTEHFEFNWCLRSPLGGGLLIQSVTQHPRAGAAQHPPRRGPKQMERSPATRHPQGSSSNILYNTAPHSSPLRILAVIATRRRLLNNFVHFGMDSLLWAGLLLEFTTRARLLAELCYETLRNLRHKPAFC